MELRQSLQELLAFHMDLGNGMRELMAFAERKRLAIGDLAHLGP